MGFARYFPVVAMILALTGCGGGGGSSTSFSSSSGSDEVYGRGLFNLGASTASSGIPQGGRSRVTPPDLAPLLHDFNECSTTICGDYGIEYSAQAGLASIGAASINNAGYTGSGIKVAVVDTGIDSSHAEFSGKTISGTNFGGGSDGVGTDGHGHGTHVASIIAGTRDGIGMRGVAYDATLYDYKAGNNSGSLIGLGLDDRDAAVYDQHVTDNIQVSNNSWAYYYFAHNYSESTLRAWRPKTIAAMRAAQENGTVFVFAAGNSGATQSLLLGGLPYRITELANEWLNVVAVGPDLKETGYTNQCGVTKDFCVTAPGGGDNQSVDGIYAAQANGTYVRYSGTSMAAPHVTGLVATVMQRFSSLTAAQIVTRVKNTASYTGLTGYYGCTASTCTTAQMEAIFGHGLVNAAAATSAIGSLTYSTDGKVYSTGSVDLSQRKLSVPHGLSSAAIKVLANQQFAVFDAFDGATFYISGAEVFDLKKSQPSPALGYSSPNNTENTATGVLSFSSAKDASSLGIPIHFSRSSDPLALSSGHAWGDKMGFMPSPSFVAKSARNQWEIVAFESENLSFRPFFQLGNDSSDPSRGIGINVSFKPTKGLALHSGWSQTTADVHLGVLDESLPTAGDIRTLEVGFEQKVSDQFNVFGRSSFNQISDRQPGITQFGLKDSSYAQLTLGAEYKKDATKLSFGVYDPGHFYQGKYSLMTPTGRNRQGQVSYAEQEISAKSEFNAGAFFAIQHDVGLGGKKYGTVSFNIQQSAYNPSELSNVSFAYQLPF